MASSDISDLVEVDAVMFANVDGAGALGSVNDLLNRWESSHTTLLPPLLRRCDKALGGVKVDNVMHCFCTCSAE